MEVLRHRFKLVAATAVAALALFGFVPASAANAEPAGQYSYECVAQDGSSYAMKQGVKLSTCRGSFLKVYIGGKFIKSIALKLPGPIKHTLPPASWYCVIAIVGAAGSAFAVVETGGISVIAYVTATADGIGGMAACTT